MNAATLLLFALLAFPPHADGDVVREAVDLLRGSDSFSSWLSGHKLQPSPVDEAFVSLARDRRESEFFLLAQSHRAGARLYGLCGLRHLHAASFVTMRRLLSRDHAKVQIVFGCMALSPTMASALKIPKQRGAASIFDNVCDDLSEAAFREGDSQVDPVDRPAPGR